MIGQTISHYGIIEKLGEGGMGIVYRARDTKLERFAALKVLPADRVADPERTRRFIQEAKAASALNHPNIITIYEIERTPDGSDFIAMEFIEGDTLRAFAGQPLAPYSVSKIGRQVAEALSVAHAGGIVHRDIKPENIMLRRDGYVKILDFGLARLHGSESAGSDDQVTRVTQPGMVFGTLAYMSPEQARGEGATGASDVFSLGLVLYELAAGRHAYPASSQLVILQAILSEQPLPPSRLQPEIPAALENVILGMLQKDPIQRPNAREVAEALADLEGRSSGVVHVQPVPVARRQTVGHEKERAEVRSCFESSCAGRGMLVCVSGEPGIGKTTLVEDFLAEAANFEPCVGKGRCSERLAGTEAYLPILEALETLLHGTMGSQLARVMKLMAPTWYVQVALHSSDIGVEQLVADAKGASQERMKREINAFFQEASRLRPLIIVLDDLHWADVSTVDVLAYLADRCASMRMLIVGTFRPTDLLLNKHPFLQVKLEQESRGSCREIPLGFLDRPDIEKYLALTFPGHRFPSEFADLIYRRTEGSPLFMVDLLRYLRDRGTLAEGGQGGEWILTQPVPQVEVGLPDSVRSMIQRKIDRLSEEDKKLLVAASVQGYEFDTATVAKALAIDPADVEERMEPLERIHRLVGLEREMELPDRTLTLRYQFVHVLYQNAFYDSLRPTRKASLSAAVAQAMLDFYGEKSGEVASQLALLFESAREFSRAVDYFVVAAQHAGQISAHREAVGLARRGLRLLLTLPDTPERTRQELRLQLALATPLMSLKGYAAPEVEEAYSRAYALCSNSANDVETYQALMGLGAFYFFRPQIRIGVEILGKLLPLAEASRNSVLLSLAHFAAASVLSHSGELAQALEHIDSCLSAYDPQKHSLYLSVAGLNPGLIGRSQWGRLLCLSGRPDQGRLKAAEALAEARKSGHSFSVCFALVFSAWVLEYCGDAKTCMDAAGEAVKIAAEQGYTMHRAWAETLHGWALSELGALDEGIAQMEKSLEGMRLLGTELIRPEFLSLLAAAVAKRGDVQGALNLVNQALATVENTGEHYYDAELHRLKGTLLLGGSNGRAVEAEASMQRAIEIARAQGARCFELRAATSLARLYLDRKRSEEARRSLAHLYAQSAEGFETRDLQEAREVLAGCGGN